jgi:hypothetical protein
VYRACASIGSSAHTDEVVNLRVKKPLGNVRGVFAVPPSHHSPRDSIVLRAMRPTPVGARSGRWLRSGDTPVCLRYATTSR